MQKSRGVCFSRSSFRNTLFQPYLGMFCYVCSLLKNYYLIIVNWNAKKIVWDIYLIEKKITTLNHQLKMFFYKISSREVYQSCFFEDCSSTRSSYGYPIFFGTFLLLLLCDCQEKFQPFQQKSSRHYIRARSLKA